MTDQQHNWAVFVNHYLLDLPTFAAILVSKTKHMVTFLKPRKDPADNTTVTRKSDWLLIEGLTREEATAFADADKASAEKMDAARKAAVSAHLKRRKDALSRLREFGLPANATASCNYSFALPANAVASVEYAFGLSQELEADNG